jgi:hypothetical protein
MVSKLLKTHVEKMSAFRLSMMLMKTRELNRSLHYVDENKWFKSGGNLNANRAPARVFRAGKPQGAGHDG